MKDISKAAPDLEAFMNHALHNTVVTFHSRLSSTSKSGVSPVDTGNFARGWQVKGGTDQVLHYSKQYTIYNDVDYAAIVVFGKPPDSRPYNWVKRKRSTWFPVFFAEQGKRIVATAAKQAEKML